MAVELVVRLAAGSYVARAKGHKVTASSTISPAFAASALAVKLGFDPSHLVEVQRDLISPGSVSFSIPNDVSG